MGLSKWSHEDCRWLLANYETHTLDEMAEKFPWASKETITSRYSTLKKRNPYQECNIKDCFAYNTSKENNCNCLDIVIEKDCPFYKEKGGCR